MQVIEMTHSEKVEMYQMIEKDRLIEMLIEANNVINRLTEVKNLRIADVSGSLPIFKCKCGYETSDSVGWCVHADCCNGNDR